MEKQQLTRSPERESQLARPSSTNEVAAIMRRFEQLSELTGWTGILHAIAQDKRHDLAPHVLELWKVKLEPFPDDDIAQVLLRLEGRFFPSVDEVVADLEALADKRRLEAQQAKLEAERREAEAARESWQDPAQQKWLKDSIKALGERLTMHRMNGLAKIARRAPENVKALSQAKALRTVRPRRVA
jgi:hypothetical protein